MGVTGENREHFCRVFDSQTPGFYSLHELIFGKQPGLNVVNALLKKSASGDSGVQA